MISANPTRRTRERGWALRMSLRGNNRPCNFTRPDIATTNSNRPASRVSAAMVQFPVSPTGRSPSEPRSSHPAKRSTVPQVRICRLPGHRYSADCGEACSVRDQSSRPRTRAPRPAGPADQGASQWSRDSGGGSVRCRILYGVLEITVVSLRWSRHSMAMTRHAVVLANG